MTRLPSHSKFITLRELNPATKETHNPHTIGRISFSGPCEISTSRALIPECSTACVLPRRECTQQAGNENGAVYVGQSMNFGAVLQITRNWSATLNLDKLHARTLLTLLCVTRPAPPSIAVGRIAPCPLLRWTRVSEYALDRAYVSTQPSRIVFSSSAGSFDSPRLLIMCPQHSTSVLAPALVQPITSPECCQGSPVGSIFEIRLTRNIAPPNEAPVLCLSLETRIHPQRSTFVAFAVPLAPFPGISIGSSGCLISSPWPVS